MSEKPSDPVVEALAALGRQTEVIRPSEALVSRMLSDARAEAGRRTTLPGVVWQMRRPALVMSALVVVIAGAFAWRTEEQQALRAGTAAFAWSDQ